MQQGIDFVLVAVTLHKSDQCLIDTPRQLIEFLTVPRYINYWQLQTHDRQVLTMGSQEDIIAYIRGNIAL